MASRKSADPSKLFWRLQWLEAPEANEADIKNDIELTKLRGHEIEDFDALKRSERGLVIVGARMTRGNEIKLIFWARLREHQRSFMRRAEAERIGLNGLG